MDPFGIIIEWLLSYFSPFFLAFTITVGYLWFFLYFYRTKFWVDLEWAERFFFGFLIGMFTMFIFSLISWPLAVFLLSFYGEYLTLGLSRVSVVDAAFLSIPLGVLLFLMFRRLSLGAPLASQKAKDSFLHDLTTHRSYWPYIFVLLFGTIYFLLGLNNTFFSDHSRFLWRIIFIFMSYGAFAVWYIIPLILTLLSSLPSTVTDKMSEIGKISRMVFRFCFLSFWKRETEVYCLREIRRKTHRKASVFRRILSFFTNDFTQKAVLVVSFATMIALADNAYCLFTPVITMVETDYEVDQIEVFRYYYSPTVYTIDVEKAYWVDLPLFRVLNLNLSITNPSNFSIYDGNKYVSGEKSPQALYVDADSSLSYSFSANAEGEIESVNVMAVGELTHQRSSIRFKYKDELDLDLITITDPISVDFGNGSICITMSLIINNTLPKRLYSHDFPLFGVQDYGNLTSFTLVENGAEKHSPSWIVHNHWLYFSFGVSSYSFSNLTISTVFMEIST